MNDVIVYKVCWIDIIDGQRLYRSAVRNPGVEYKISQTTKPPVNDNPFLFVFDTLKHARFFKFDFINVIFESRAKLITKKIDLNFPLPLGTLLASEVTPLKIVE